MSLGDPVPRQPHTQEQSAQLLSKLDFVKNFLDISGRDSAGGKLVRFSTELYEVLESATSSIQDQRILDDSFSKSFMRNLALAVKTLQTSPDFSFYREGYSGTMWDDGASAKPAPHRQPKLREAQPTKPYCLEAIDALRGASKLVKTLSCTQLGDELDRIWSSIAPAPLPEPKPLFELRAPKISGQPWILDRLVNNERDDLSNLQRQVSYHKASAVVDDICNTALAVKALSGDESDSILKNVRDAFIKALWAGMSAVVDQGDTPDKQWRLHERARLIFEKFSKGTAEPSEQIEYATTLYKHADVEAECRRIGDWWAGKYALDQLTTMSLEEFRASLREWKR